MSLRGVIAVLALVLLLAPAAAQADELDFTVGASAAPGGSDTISYAGGTNPLVGSNISITSVVGVGTPSNDGVSLAITNGILNFTTGNLTSTNPTHWFFGGGGNITLTGDIPSLGLTGVTLFSGSFSSASVKITGNELRLTIGVFTDTKDGTLTGYYGLPGGLYAGTMEITFNLYSQVSTPNAFTSWSIISGTITNTPVPEPGTLTLLGTGLLGLAFAARRKLGL